MNYPAPTYGVVVPAAKSKVVPSIICIVVFIFVFTGISALAIGLGVGLTREHSDSSGSSSIGDSSSSNNNYSILSAPIVNCTYGGSSTCGCSAIKPSFLSPRIVQGYTAVANSWPWMVALYINNGALFCGGFLVSYQYVITAAHCVNDFDASTIKVYAGLQKLSERSSAQMRTVTNKIVYSNYSTSGYTNDIAILKLASSFDQNSTIGVCCLTSDNSLPSLGEHGVIIGWGKTSANSLSQPDDLLQGVVQVQQDSTSCSTSTTSSIQFCTGYSGTNACFGDSGGPFMTSVNNSWTCTGIASSGNNCIESSYYTRLSHYRQFIDDFMNS
jgi:secreted trypsin-like serine protease